MRFFVVANLTLLPISIDYPSQNSAAYEALKDARLMVWPSDVWLPNRSQQRMTKTNLIELGHGCRLNCRPHSLAHYSTEQA